MKPKVVNTIRGQIYEYLKQEICDGEYKPGQWLQEKEIAEQFSVSRSPVREALKQLSADGLVTEIPNKGVFVREFTPKDIEEIFDLRVMLECYAIEKTIEHQKENEENREEIRTQLTACLEKLEDTYQKKELTLYTVADTELHDQIIRLSGNEFLGIIYERVHLMVQQFRIYSIMDLDRYDGSMVEHRELIDYILSGNTEEAIAINRKHLELAKERVKIYVSELAAEK